MSMSAYPNFAYTLTLAAFLEKLYPLMLPKKAKALWQAHEHLKDCEMDEEKFIPLLKRACKKAGILAPDSVFHLSDEDFPVDLECGVIYVCWDEGTLYERKPSRGLKQLEAKGIKPQGSAWCNWG
jgi:hypothetical protein